MALKPRTCLQPDSDQSHSQTQSQSQSQSQSPGLVIPRTLLLASLQMPLCVLTKAFRVSLEFQRASFHISLNLICFIVFAVINYGLMSNFRFQSRDQTPHSAFRLIHQTHTFSNLNLIVAWAMWLISGGFVQWSASICMNPNKLINYNPIS